MGEGKLKEGSRQESTFTARARRAVRLAAAVGGFEPAIRQVLGDVSDISSRSGY